MRSRVASRMSIEAQSEIGRDHQDRSRQQTRPMGESRAETAGGLAGFWRGRRLRGRLLWACEGRSSSDEACLARGRPGGSSGAAVAALVSYPAIRSMLNRAMREAGHAHGFHPRRWARDGRDDRAARTAQRGRPCDRARLVRGLQALRRRPERRRRGADRRGGAFCAGADLKAIAEGETRPIEPDGDSVRWARRGSGWASR